LAGNFLGSLEEFSAPQLGASVAREVARRAGLDLDRIDECILAKFLAPDWGKIQRVRRLSSAVFSQGGSAMMANKVCGSRLKAVAMVVEW